MVRSSAAAAYLYFSQLHINNNRYNIASAEVLSANTKPEKPQKFLTIYLHGYRQFFLSVLCALSGLCVFLILPQRRQVRQSSVLFPVYGVQHQQIADRKSAGSKPSLLCPCRQKFILHHGVPIVLMIAVSIAPLCAVGKPKPNRASDFNYDLNRKGDSVYISGYVGKSCDQMCYNCASLSDIEFPHGLAEIGQISQYRQNALSMNKERDIGILNPAKMDIVTAPMERTIVVLAVVRGYPSKYVKQ